MRSGRLLKLTEDTEVGPAHTKKGAEYHTDDFG